MYILLSLIYIYTYLFIYVFIYPQAAWFAVAVIDNVVVGLGWSAITFQEAVLSHCVVRVGWLSIGAVVTIHFQGSVLR